MVIVIFLKAFSLLWSNKGKIFSTKSTRTFPAWFKLHYVTQLLRYGWCEHNRRLFEKGSAGGSFSLGNFSTHSLHVFIAIHHCIPLSSFKISIIWYTTTITRLLFLSRGVLDWGCSSSMKKNLFEKKNRKACQKRK